MDEMQKHLLKEVAALDALPVGAYNIRSNGKSAARNTTAEIDIVTKEDKQGIDVIIKPGTKNKSVHIPVIISQTGLKELVYNDFFVGEDCDVTIIAGCGISNCGGEDSEHDGVHSFFVKKNSRVKYIEKHYGEGTGRGKRLMNPSTVVELGENSTMEMETSQIGGIDDTVRITRAKLEENASLIVHDKILTEGDQKAKAELAVQLNGDGSTCDMISRGVARGQSRQEVVISIDGNAACSGHAECDSIIMEKGVIVATPRLTATNVDAALIHEAAIGKIAGEQLTKLMTMGLDEKEAEEMIIRGFLQ
ncbi:MAG: SufD family Fe-S cluster assembly protein [Lachnospiraceae bacterium]|jgi:Fe-S cluster assembly scaffold protein SufB|nr:SufD family Fe-S cluster assembly protein [Lachnospiraceae bacterium]